MRFGLSLEGGVQSLKLPLPLLCRLKMAVGGPGFLLSASTRLTRSCKGCRGTCAGALMLKMPEVDGNLQLVPLMRQAKVLRLEADIDVGKLFSKLTQCTHSLLEK